MTRIPELMAPAGSWEALLAAVENGVDAVYLGGKSFSARQSAANFDGDELSRAVSYAHMRGVRIYVTVNTLIADSEMGDALDFLFFLQELGVDAVIVQDAGLAYLSGKILPELPLHASTQMTVHNTPAAVAARSLGFERVVLSREMSLEEIKALARKSGLEVEVFVHGALCICYSGQCLFSSMIGGRSGNRGRCAQPCRMQYRLVEGRGSTLATGTGPGSYLLSPRDLNMSGHLPDLCSAGISALKIEGRMKRPEYVATVVRIYRGLLNRHVCGGEHGVTPEEETDLAQVFNREFTTGYFYGRQGRAMMSPQRPNNRGVRIGRVRSVDSRAGMVEVLLERPLNAGDGLEIWVSEGGRSGFTVNEILVEGIPVNAAPAGVAAVIAAPGRINTGDRVFKTHDAGLIKRARESFLHGGRIPLDIHISAAVDKPLTLTVRDRSGRTAAASTRSRGQEAVKHPLTYDYLEKQVGRLGNTPFVMNDLACDIKGGVMIPVSEINEARRAALAGLEKKILEAARKTKTPVDRRLYEERKIKHLVREGVTPGTRGKTMLSVAVGDLDSVEKALAAGAGIIYFSSEGLRSKGKYDRHDLLAAARVCAGERAEFWLAAPRITADREIEDFLDTVNVMGGGLAGVLAGNLGLATEVLKSLPYRRVVFDFGFNVFNKYSLEYYLSLGAHRITLSPELTLSQVKELAGQGPVEVLVQGALELMVSGHCLLGSVFGDKPDSCRGPCLRQSYALKDRTGAVFPVETDRFCRTHIFNSRDLCVVEDLPDLAAAKVACVRIEARSQSPAYVEETVALYRKALDGIFGAGRMPDLAAIKETLSRLSPAGITKGHYYRGVL